MKFVSIGVGLAFACASAGLLAQDLASMTPEQIQACTQRNVVDLSATRTLNVVTTDRGGRTQNLGMELFWKPGDKPGSLRMNLKVSEPPDLADSAFLLVQEGGNEAVWFFLPAGAKAMRLLGSDLSRPLWGTDFSYGEIKQVQGILAAGAARRLADATVANRPVFVLETTTSAEDLGYKKIVSYVDQQSCVLLKSEFVGANNQPRKVLEADAGSVRSSGGRSLVASYTMRDLGAGSQTRLSLSDYVPSRLSDGLFDPQTFGTAQK